MEHLYKEYDKWCIAFCVFLFMIVFWGVMHPIPITTTDDWLYMSDNRVVLPIWGSWNPAKVLPEVLAPICGSISAFVVAPLIGDYVLSFSVTICMLTSIIVAIYCTMFFQICKCTMRIPASYSSLATLFFLMLHFAIFRSAEMDNPYLFYAWDLNCYYNYVIPNLLNAIMVMYCVKSNILIRFFDRKVTIGRSIFVLICYLCLASNLFGSIIFASYLFITIVTRIYRKRKSFNYHGFLSSYGSYIILLTFWCAVQLFELSGVRSQVLGEESMDTSFLSQLRSSCYYWLSALGGMNRWVGILMVLSVVVSSFVLYKNRKEPCYHKFQNLIFLWLTISVAVHIYCILVCAKSRPYYIARPEVMASGYYCVISMSLVQMIVILRKYRTLLLLLPIVILFYYTQANSDYNTYRDVASDSFQERYESNVAAVLLIKQIDKQNIKVVDLYVTDRFPVAKSYWLALSRTMNKHGQIKNKLTINAVTRTNSTSPYWVDFDDRRQ